MCAASETHAQSLEQASILGPYELSKDGPLTSLGLQSLAVARLVAEVQRTGVTHEPIVFSTVPGPLREYRFTWEKGTDSWPRTRYRFVAASSVDGKNELNEVRRSGLGTPLGAVRRGDLPDEPVVNDAVFPIYRYFYPLTAVLEMGPESPHEPREVRLRLVDPRETDTFALKGVDYPLATDIGAQFRALGMKVDSDFSISGLRNAEKLMSLAGLYAAEPLRTDKIPVILVHGLASGPTTWRQALVDLVLDPELRTNYQFWLYAYPTGLPFPYAALFLRDALVQTMEELGPHPRLRESVLVAHSMGGLLARMQVGDSDTLLWDAVFDVPPQEIDLEPADVELLSRVLIFEPLPFVTRAVFFSVPHRGSRMAAKTVGRLGATVVSLPDELKEMEERIRASGVELTEEGRRRGIADSIQLLQPESRLVKALDLVDIDTAVTYHTVVGDRGKGDTPDSSDGVVPYWSSHLDGATSELIVPSGHGSHESKAGVAELERILEEHLEEVGGQ